MGMEGEQAALFWAEFRSGRSSDPPAANFGTQFAGGTQLSGQTQHLMRVRASSMDIHRMPGPL
jgi:hypothetical protein